MFNSKAFRRDHGIYQAELARILGLSQSAISRIENDDLDLSNKQLRILYEKFGEDEVNKYIVDEACLPEEKSGGDETLEQIGNLVRVIESQNELIASQVEEQNATIKQILSTNERLMALLEKLAIE